MANVKVGRKQTNKQTNRQTDRQGKNNMPPDPRSGGHKNYVPLSTNASGKIWLKSGQ